MVSHPSLLVQFPIGSIICWSNCRVPCSCALIDCMIDFGILSRFVLLAVCVTRSCHSSFELCHPPCHVCSSSLLVVSVGQARSVGCVDAFYRSAVQVPTDRAVVLSIGLLSFSLFFSRVVVVVVVQWYQYRYCLDCLDWTVYLIHICTFYRFILTELCLYIHTI